MTDPLTKNMGGPNFKIPAIMLSITGILQRVKLGPSGLDLKDSGILFIPKQFDLNLELLVLLLKLCHLVWHINMLPEASEESGNTSIGLLTSDLPKVSQCLVMDMSC